jgi:hypothetical protein
MPSARVAVGIALLLLSAGPATGQEGPRASAPLPPPLPAAPPEAGQSEADQSQAKPAAPKIKSDRSTSRLPKRSVSRLKHASRKDVRRKSASARSQTTRPASRSAAIAGSRRVPAHTPGRLSPPPEEYYAPRVESAAAAPTQAPRPPLPYYRELPAGPPGNAYPPSFPYPWPPPGPGLIGRGF